MKYILICLAMLSSPLFAETYIVQADSAYSAANWLPAGTPGEGDTLDLNGKVVSMDVAAIPASGTLALIRSGAANNSAGQITVALNAGFPLATIAATTIQAGTAPTNRGIILVSSDNVARQFILYTGTGTAGLRGGKVGSANAYGVQIAGACTSIFNGDITGGDASATYGVFFNSSLCVATFNGNITGGSANYNAWGVSNGGGTYTLNGSLINTAACMAWSGKPPAFTNTGKTYYVQFNGTSGPKYGPEPAAGEMLDGVVCGSTTGTYVPDVPDFPDVGNVLSTDTVNGSNGTLTLPDAANVWFGSGAYGVGGTGSTPSKRASSITNCEAANIKPGVVIDDVTGTYDPITGQFSDPGIANVLIDVPYTYAGESLLGTFDESDRNHDPLESNVWSGVTYRIMGVDKTGTKTSRSGRVQH
jgi:hypothetical protein